MIPTTSPLSVCNNCGGGNPQPQYRACPDCRRMWREDARKGRMTRDELIKLLGSTICQINATGGGNASTIRAENIYKGWLREKNAR